MKTAKPSPSQQIYTQINTDRFIENQGYSAFIKKALRFVEQEVLPHSWHSDFYHNLRHAWDFLHQKCTAEQLFEQEKIAFNNLEHLDEHDKAIGNLVRWCLNSGMLTMPYIEQTEKSKFLGIKRTETIVTDNVMIFLGCLEDISPTYPEKFYDFLTS